MSINYLSTAVSREEYRAIEARYQAFHEAHHVRVNARMGASYYMVASFTTHAD